MQLGALTGAKPGADGDDDDDDKHEVPILPALVAGQAQLFVRKEVSRARIALFPSSRLVPTCALANVGCCWGCCCSGAAATHPERARELLAWYGLQIGSAWTCVWC